jgi:predicted DNA-binding protein YlxM (UPF0122 family)
VPDFQLVFRQGGYLSYCQEKTLDNKAVLGYDRQGDLRMEEILMQTLLFDFYGDLLTDKQRQVYQQVVLDDYSLSETAEQLSISRQGVHDMIRRCRKILDEYERTLHLVERFMKIREQVHQIQKLAREHEIGEIEAIAGRILDEL